MSTNNDEYFVVKMMRFVLKTRNFVVKMIEFCKVVSSECRGGNDDAAVRCRCLSAVYIHAGA